MSRYSHRPTLAARSCQRTQSEAAEVYLEIPTCQNSSKARQAGLWSPPASISGQNSGGNRAGAVALQKWGLCCTWRVWRRGKIERCRTAFPPTARSMRIPNGRRWPSYQGRLNLRRTHKRTWFPSRAMYANSFMTTTLKSGYPRCCSNGIWHAWISYRSHLFSWSCHRPTGVPAGRKAN